MFKPVRLVLLGALLLSGLFLANAWVVPQGRMTGGGSFFQGFMRITHGFELHCDPTKGPNNLEVNWGEGNRFHLDSLAAATCWDTLPSADPPPGTPLTTLYGAGPGTYNGVPGAYANWQFSDHGEPGTSDEVTYLIISDASGNVVLSAGPAPLTFGNHQAHKETGN